MSHGVPKRAPPQTPLQSFVAGFFGSDSFGYRIRRVPVVVAGCLRATKSGCSWRIE